MEIDYSAIIGKPLKDENGREIGKIQSFLIESSGKIKEVLIENRNEDFVKYPIERLKIREEEVSLTSDFDKKVEILSEKFPLTRRKREILDNLSKNNEVLPEIYKGLCAEFDRALDEMKHDAQSLLGDIEKQVQVQEDSIKSLHLARTFLEIEHGVGKVKDEVYQLSLLSILREIKNLSYRKLNLLKTKDKISSILYGDREAEPEKEINEDQSSSANEPIKEKPVITVRMTQE